jgi:acyl-homoserine lactone acylase PvdQ
VTSLLPDSQDLFVEDVKDGKYLSSDGTWKEVKTIHEKIKVRFGFDVEFDINYTENGVLLPRDALDRQTNSFYGHFIPEVWE